MLLRQIGKKQTAGSSCHLPSFLDKNEKRTTWDNFAGCQIHWTNMVTWDKAVWLLNLTVFSSVQWQQRTGLGGGSNWNVDRLASVWEILRCKTWMQVCVLAQIWRESQKNLTPSLSDLIRHSQGPWQTDGGSDYRLDVLPMLPPFSRHAWCCKCNTFEIITSPLSGSCIMKSAWKQLQNIRQNKSISLKKKKNRKTLRGSWFCQLVHTNEPTLFLFLFE